MCICPLHGGTEDGHRTADQEEERRAVAHALDVEDRACIDSYCLVLDAMGSTG